MNIHLMTQMMKILLDPNIDHNRGLSKQTKALLLFFDVRTLKHRDDIKKDMYGKWMHHGPHTDVFKCQLTSFPKKLLKGLFETFAQYSPIEQAFQESLPWLQTKPPMASE